MVSKNKNTPYRQSAAGNKSTYKPTGEKSPSVNGETIDNVRRQHAAKLLAMTATEHQVNTQNNTSKKPITISPAEHLRIAMLRQERAKIQAAPLLKTWEDAKPCKDEEDSAWRDAAFRSSAIATCRNTCTFVLECLEKDRILGGESGIRAGMDQDKRQDAYSRELDLGDIADSIYVARALLKLN